MKAHQMVRRYGLIGTLTILSMLALFLALPTSALAASTQGTKCAKADVKCVTGIGDTLISDRLASLGKLHDSINDQLNAKHITSDQANALQADVSTNVQGLNNLKTKLDGETKTADARLDVHNIFYQFRIYAVVLPRDYQQLHFDIERQIDAELRGTQTAIEQSIDKAPANQKSKLNDLYSDYKTQMTTAESQFDIVQKDLPTLTPENFNNNHSTYAANLAAVHNAEKTAHTAIHKAAQDLHKIANLLK